MNTRATRWVNTRATRWVSARRVIMIILALALIAPLSACGKRGSLEKPEGEKVEYPRNYPR